MLGGSSVCFVLPGDVPLSRGHSVTGAQDCGFEMINMSRIREHIPLVCQHLGMDTSEAVTLQEISLQNT